MRVAIADGTKETRVAFDEYLSRCPRARQWQLRTFESASDLFYVAKNALFDVVAISLRFSGNQMNGRDFIRAMRSVGCATPILLYSCEDWTPQERAQCLDDGAADVMHMPLSAAEEFVARLASLARRQAIRQILVSADDESSSSLSIDHLTLSHRRRRESHPFRNSLNLTKNSFALLSVLFAVRPRTAGYADLLRAIGYSNSGTRHTVTEAIRQLRAQLEETPVAILPVPGVGYRLVVPDSDTQNPESQLRKEQAMVYRSQRVR